MQPLDTHKTVSKVQTCRVIPSAQSYVRVILPSFLPSSSSVGKQSQLLLKPTEVELGLQVGVEFDNKIWNLALELIMLFQPITWIEVMKNNTS